ncbi:MAG: hypothetical protein DRJ03_17840 [Chloroflexi bacterium]|nr:MAG: hypothetical protein DRJ03_17840 [Chloroflexota bacterium]
MLVLTHARHAHHVAHVQIHILGVPGPQDDRVRFGQYLVKGVRAARGLSQSGVILGQVAVPDTRQRQTRVLEQEGVIITPTTRLPAPAIPQVALPGGESDLTTLTEIMRFATPANLTGLPAISFPAGYNDAGLPTGMQALERAWQESTLLHLALAAEQIVERQSPQMHYEILAE